MQFFFNVCFFFWTGVVTQVLELELQKARSSSCNNLDNVQKQVRKIFLFVFLFRKSLIVNRISSMTYFNKYFDIYRYSRNGTFLFFFLFKLLHIFYRLFFFFVQAKISAKVFIFMQNIVSQINEK